MPAARSTAIDPGFYKVAAAFAAIGLVIIGGALCWGGHTFWFVQHSTRVTARVLSIETRSLPDGEEFRKIYTFIDDRERTYTAPAPSIYQWPPVGATVPICYATTGDPFAPCQVLVLDWRRLLMSPLILCAAGAFLCLPLLIAQLTARRARARPLSP